MGCIEKVAREIILDTFEMEVKLFLSFAFLQISYDPSKKVQHKTKKCYTKGYT